MIHFCYCMSCAKLQGLPNKDYVRALIDREHIAKDFVDHFANKYLEEVANGTHNKGGWPNWIKLGWAAPMQAYTISKIAIITYVSDLHNNLVVQPKGEKKINVFNNCLGYVLTDMFPNGTKTMVRKQYLSIF